MINKKCIYNGADFLKRQKAGAIVSYQTEFSGLFQIEYFAGL